MITSFIGDVRRNHALEHATVSLLIGRMGPDLRVVGRASGDGFFLLGDMSEPMLTECVHEALQRLQRGEAFWAVTPHCGTNIATAGTLTSLASMAVLGSKGQHKDRLGMAILACMGAVIVSQPVGRMIQRYLTTDADLADTEIVSIETKNGHFYKVRTRRRAA